MRLVPRLAWRARPPRARRRIPGPVEGVAIHWEGPPLGSFPHSLCAGKVRAIQRFHMDARGWDDIAYSAVVCPHGHVFEGRWIGIRTAANGTSYGNNRYYAVCYWAVRATPSPRPESAASTTLSLRFGELAQDARSDRTRGSGQPCARGTPFEHGLRQDGPAARLPRLTPTTRPGRDAICASRLRSCAAEPSGYGKRKCGGEAGGSASTGFMGRNPRPFVALSSGKRGLQSMALSGHKRGERRGAPPLHSKAPAGDSPSFPTRRSAAIVSRGGPGPHSPAQPGAASRATEHARWSGLAVRATMGMGLLEWIVVGLIVGALARLFMAGPDPIGCLGTVFIGIVGAVIGGKLWTVIFGPQRGVAWIGSVLVAMFLLAIFRRVTYPRI